LDIKPSDEDERFRLINEALASMCLGRVYNANFSKDFILRELMKTRNNDYI
jgi:hypothetical protein